MQCLSCFGRWDWSDALDGSFFVNLAFWTWAPQSAGEINFERNILHRFRDWAWVSAHFLRRARRSVFLWRNLPESQFGRVKAWCWHVERINFFERRLSFGATVAFLRFDNWTWFSFVRLNRWKWWLKFWCFRSRSFCCLFGCLLALESSSEVDCEINKTLESLVSSCFAMQSFQRFYIKVVFANFRIDVCDFVKHIKLFEVKICLSI